MRIETDRLIIRSFTLSDEADLREYMLQRVDAEYEGYPDFTADKSAEEIAYRAGSDEFFAIELKDGHKVIGNVYMGKRDFDSREIGYVLNERYLRMGYGSEACGAVAAYFLGRYPPQKGGACLGEETRRIYAECAPGNTASWKLLEKLGFRREGHLRQNVSFHRDARGNPIYWDTYLYAVLKSDGVFGTE